MSVEIECADCTWEDDLRASEMPVFCPDCGGKIVRASEPRSLGDRKTNTDKI